METLNMDDAIDRVVSKTLPTNNKYIMLINNIASLKLRMNNLEYANRKFDDEFLMIESSIKQLALKKEEQIRRPFSFIYLILAISISTYLIYMWFKGEFFGYFILSFGWIIILSPIFFVILVFTFSRLQNIMTKSIYSKIRANAQNKIDFERIRIKSKKNLNYIEIDSISDKLYKAEKSIDNIIEKEREIIIMNQTHTKTTSFKLNERSTAKNSSTNNIINSFKNQFYDIENRADLSDDNKIIQIIKIYSAICATIAIQPIPFADIFILTPVQLIMGKKIADIRGYQITNNEINELLKEIVGILGLGIIAQQLAIGAYKTFIPFLGGLATIPMVFGLTFGIGKVMDYYIVNKISGKTPSAEEFKNIFKEANKEGKEEGRQKASEIKNRNI